MKKLLITTTALMATAGMAAADGHVSISGNAEMGIASVDTAASTTDGDAALHQDIDVTFKFAGETDGGLSFGGAVDLDEAGNLDATSVADQSTGASAFIKGGFGSLTLGDTDGALDWAMTEANGANGGTAIADDHTSHAGYTGNSELDNEQVLRYDNSFGDFGVAVSLSQIDEDDVDTQIGVKYNADLGGTTLGLGLGYATQGDDDLVGISAKFGIAGVAAVLGYKDGTVGGADVTHTYIGLGYSSGALGFHLNYGEKETAGVKVDGIGATVNYDLGGGAVVALGYGTDDAADRYSLGIRMDF